jgi:hypothetical protein
MAVGGHGADEINEVHETAAEQVAEGVGVVRQNQLGHFRLRFGNAAHGQRMSGEFHGLALSMGQW